MNSHSIREYLGIAQLQVEKLKDYEFHVLYIVPKVRFLLGQTRCTYPLPMISIPVLNNYFVTVITPR